MRKIVYVVYSSWAFIGIVDADEAHIWRAFGFTCERTWIGGSPLVVDARSRRLASAR